MLQVRQWLKNGMKFSVRDTLVTLLFLSGALILSALLQRYDKGNYDASLLLVLAVFLIARTTEGYFYGIAASLCSVLLVNLLFTYPYFEFNFTLTGYPVAILSMLAVSVITSTLTTQAKYSAKAQLDAEREKTRSNLLRAVSHDLRTPLTGILGASSAMLDSKASLTPQEQQNLLQDIHDDAQWLIRMVENLLTITRMDDTKQARVVKIPEVGEEILEAAVSKFRRQFPQWQVSVQTPEEILLLPMDAVLIEQVLMNLLGNVVDHGVGADRIWVTLERQGSSGVFTVRDNGCGIDPALLPKVFSGASHHDGRSSDSKRNMGIGLSVCRTIVQAHGGTMEAENGLDHGAVFRFSLPLEEVQYE